MNGHRDWKRRHLAGSLAVLLLLFVLAVDAGARTRHRVVHHTPPKKTRHVAAPVRKKRTVVVVRKSKAVPVRPTAKAHSVTHFTAVAKPTKPTNVDTTSTVSKSDSHPVSVDEPRTPPGYETETQLLARAYRLRDLALNEEQKGDHGLAVKHLMDATQLSTQYYGKPVSQEALLYFDLGIAAAAAEQNDVAREAFQQCLERKPDMSEAQMRMAMVLARQGKQAEALTYARQAVELQPEDARAHLVLSLLLERQGKLEEAKSEKAKARQLAKAAGITTPKELMESGTPIPGMEEPVPEPEAPAGQAVPIPDAEPEL